MCDSEAITFTIKEFVITIMTQLRKLGDVALLLPSLDNLTVTGV